MGGFERKQYSERLEQTFDQAFAYERPLTETFRYAHTMQHGTPEQCAALRVQAIQEQRQADQQAVAERQAAEQRPQLAKEAELGQQPLSKVEQVRAAEQQRVRGPKL